MALKKKSIILLLCLMLVMPVAVLAAEGDLSVLEKPAGLTVRSDESNDLYLRLTLPDSIIELIDPENESDYYDILCEFDWKINDGPWKFDSNWDGFCEQGLVDYYTVFETFQVAEELRASARSICAEGNHTGSRGPPDTAWQRGEEQAIALSVRTHDKAPEIMASGSNSSATKDTGAKLPDGFPSELIQIYEGGKITSVEEKTFAGGHKGCLITVDHSGQKDSVVNGVYYSVMASAKDLDAMIGMHSHYYGTKDRYWGVLGSSIQFDFCHWSFTVNNKLYSCIFRKQNRKKISRMVIMVNYTTDKYGKNKYNKAN